MRYEHTISPNVTCYLLHLDVLIWLTVVAPYKTVICHL